MPRHLIKRLERLEHQTPSNAFEHLTVEQIERIAECYAMSQQLPGSSQALSTAECLADACEALPNDCDNSVRLADD
jgi:hypothetical protein